MHQDSYEGAFDSMAEPDAKKSQPEKRFDPNKESKVEAELRRQLELTQKQLSEKIDELAQCKTRIGKLKERKKTWKFKCRSITRKLSQLAAIETEEPKVYETIPTAPALSSVREEKQLSDGTGPSIWKGTLRSGWGKREEIHLKARLIHLHSSTPLQSAQALKWPLQLEMHGVCSCDEVQRTIRTTEAKSTLITVSLIGVGEPESMKNYNQLVDCLIKTAKMGIVDCIPKKTLFVAPNAEEPSQLVGYLLPKLNIRPKSTNQKKFKRQQTKQEIDLGSDENTATQQETKKFKPNPPDT